MSLTNKQRLDLISQHIREHKYVDLHSLAERFETSVSTIRRSLNELEAQGLIRRHHGGASLVEQDPTSGYDFITQDQSHASEKHAIAAHLAEQIRPGMTVMLDGGTTTYAVARMLTSKRVIVITNSLPIAALLNEVSSCETVVTGGTVYNRLGVLYGPTCEAALASMHADWAILGFAGLTAEGVWNSNPMIVGYQRSMAAAADRTLYVGDPSKFDRRATTLAAPFRPGMTVVSSAEPGAAVRRALKAAGATWEVAPLHPVAD